MNSKILLITTFLLVFSLGLFAQQQTTDGGYIFGGNTNSYTHGSGDLLLYKLGADLKKQWRKNYGGEEPEAYAQVIQTSDGGYVVCGSSESYSNGKMDFLVYKLDASGQKQWRKNFGGYNEDDSCSIAQTSDGGFIVAGDTDSYGNGGMDFLVYRLDAGGQKLWRKTYGGIHDEGFGFISPTSDGGFVICGYSDSYSNGDDDFLVYKLSATGAKLWRKNYGGDMAEWAMSVRQTTDGGYVVAGWSNSYAAPPLGRMVPANPDFLVYKLDAAGQKQWRKNFGGSESDRCYDIRQIHDGGFVVTGDSESYNQGAGDLDFLVYRLDANGQKLWRRNYGGMDNDFGFRIFQTASLRFMLVGDGRSYNQTGSDSDLLLYNINTSGGMKWYKNFGGDMNETAFSHLY